MELDDGLWKSQETDKMVNHSSVSFFRLDEMNFKHDCPPVATLPLGTG